MMIAEPVQNSGGAFTPPPGYWQGLREICDRYGILLCVDEVICGFGRLGRWFGSERFDIQPDLLTFAKGLTSAYFAMGGVLMHDRVAQPLLGEGEMFMHGITFGGHPVGSAVALKNLEIIEREGLAGERDEQRAVAERAAERDALAADRRRCPRYGALLGDRARRRPGDEGDVQRRRGGRGPRTTCRPSWRSGA